MSASDKTVTRRVEVERITVTSTRSFEIVAAKLAASIGHPDMPAFARAVVAARNLADLEGVVNAATGAAGLMEMAHFDVGEVLRKELGEGAPKAVRFVIGNPLIMKEMVKCVPDAASYAPVTVLLDERAGSVCLSYDLVASLLAQYGNENALTIARRLDDKILTLLTAAAA